MKICCNCGNKFKNSLWVCPSCGDAQKLVDGYLAFAPELANTSDSYDASFFCKLATLEAKNFWFRSRNRLIIWALMRYFPQAKSFLEIGCGTGFVLSGIEPAFPKLTLSGSEIFTIGLGFASQRLYRTELFQMDARKMPFEDEFDVIGAFDVLEHIQEDTKVLDEMHRSICEGGGILINVPQHPWLWSPADDYAHHVRRYRDQELRTKVERAGFKVVRMTSFVSLLLPLMLLSRLRYRQLNFKYDITSELKTSAWMNAILEFILNIEVTMIKLGISLPIGGSLFLIAKKI